MNLRPVTPDRNFTKTRPETNLPFCHGLRVAIEHNRLWDFKAARRSMRKTITYRRGLLRSRFIPWTPLRPVVPGSVLFDFLADATVFWKFMGFTPKEYLRD
jgi:hypothetical protein